MDSTEADFSETDSKSRPDSGIGGEHKGELVSDRVIQGELRIEDPLSDPIIRLSLEDVKISGRQLIDMSVKELNKRLTTCNCPSFIISKLKRCRRTLKNRGYAKNCRIRRLAARNQLETVNAELAIENKQLRHHNRLLMNELDLMREREVSNTVQSTSLPNGGYNFSGCLGNNESTLESYEGNCSSSHQVQPAFNQTSCMLNNDDLYQQFEFRMDQVGELISSVEGEEIESFEMN